MSSLLLSKMSMLHVMAHTCMLRNCSSMYVVASMHCTLLTKAHTMYIGFSCIQKIFYLSNQTKQKTAPNNIKFTVPKLAADIKIQSNKHKELMKNNNQ